MSIIKIKEGVFDIKYTVKPITKLQRDLKRVHKRGYNISILTDIIRKLANGE